MESDGLVYVRMIDQGDSRICGPQELHTSEWKDSAKRLSFFEYCLPPFRHLSEKPLHRQCEYRRCFYGKGIIIALGVFQQHKLFPMENYP